MEEESLPPPIFSSNLLLLNQNVANELIFDSEEIRYGASIVSCGGERAYLAALTCSASEDRLNATFRFNARSGDLT